MQKLTFQQMALRRPFRTLWGFVQQAGPNEGENGAFLPEMDTKPESLGAGRFRLIWQPSTRKGRFFGGFRGGRPQAGRGKGEGLKGRAFVFRCHPPKGSGKFQASPRRGPQICPACVSSFVGGFGSNRGPSKKGTPLPTDKGVRATP